MSSLYDQFDIADVLTDAPEKVYVGRREPRWVGVGHRTVVLVREGAHTRPLEPVGRYSQGFEWGYEGRGCAELAVSLLADHLGYEPPLGVVMSFRASAVAHLARDGWELRASDIAGWLRRNLVATRG